MPFSCLASADRPETKARITIVQTYTPPAHGFRTFVVVWAAQSLSVIGSGMTGFALNVYLAQVLYPAPEQKAELALAFTALNLGFTIPFVFGGPLAGAWADRHDRKQIMIVTNVINGMATLATLTLMLAGNLQVWMLVAIGVLAAAASAFHYAAFDASYAMLVADRQLPRANGMMQTTWSLSGIISLALAARRHARRYPARDRHRRHHFFLLCGGPSDGTRAFTDAHRHRGQAAGSNKAYGPMCGRARPSSGEGPHFCGCSPRS